MNEFQTPSLVATETGKLLEQEVYLNLVRTTEEVRLPLTDLLAGFGLSGKQYNALRAIRRSGSEGETPSGIGTQMAEPRADVTRLLDRLERESLIERRHDQKDRRVVRVLLSERGQRVLADIDEPLLQLHRNQFAHMRREDLEALSRLLVLARTSSEP
ncbi:DNA-binding transcriptional regulator, MarR family [Pseudomonas cuatrocienegasensis]|uniref:DNA-binding transcriptional regulator, MarR family n=1 Tax=Pseudomonas cuatrocienegasensis TaxID=543360 RepID=A0ABY1B078_9PSED|nr:transcriptional regulator [Pseudomonas sp. 21C1]SEP61933.1 DNA-binding transcriptional regulator, MarR family [Pseudomonas cuatrocienegasensis]